MMTLMKRKIDTPRRMMMRRSKKKKRKKKVDDSTKARINGVEQAGHV